MVWLNMIGIMVNIKAFNITFTSSLFPVLSISSDLSALFLYKKSNIIRNINAAKAPARVPAVPPAAPYAADSLRSLNAFIK